MKHTGPIDHALQKRFQIVIGSLLYLMLGTCPDIAFAVTQLAQHTANLFPDHLSKALYICRYLVGTCKTLANMTQIHSKSKLTMRT